MANAAIFNALMGRPVRSVDDYLTQYEDRDARKAAIQQNALAAMQNQQLREAQIGEIRTRQQQAIAEQQAKQQQEAARRAALLRAGPVTGIQANAATGITGPTPQAAAAIGQRRQINASELLAAGVPIEQIRLLAEGDTLGMPEVARVLDTIGADRMPVQRREDKFGRPIGDPLAKPVEMKLQDLGGTVQAVNPFALTPGQTLNKTMTQAERDSSARGWAGINIQRQAEQRQAEAAKATAANNAAGANITEGERNAGGYAARMVEASKLLDQFEGKGRATYKTDALGGVPLVGRALQTSAMTAEQQQYRQAQEDWVRAKLRKESGAAIGVDEMAREISAYFPEPGDLPANVEQKRQARAVANAAMVQSAGRGAPKSAAVPPGTVLKFDAQGNPVK